MESQIEKNSKTGVIGYIRKLFGFENNTSDLESADEIIEQSAEREELRASTKRINDMMKKYSIENFEVSEKTPKIKKAQSKKQKLEKEKQQNGNKDVEERNQGKEIER